MLPQTLHNRVVVILKSTRRALGLRFDFDGVHGTRRLATKRAWVVT
jgi:hypothetical protein